jgi:uncharacterized protein YcfL
MSRTTRVATLLRKTIADTPEYELYEYDNQSLKHLATTKSNRAIAIGAMGQLQHRNETKNSRLVYVS